MEAEEQLKKEKRANSTVFQMDYNHSMDVLAVCGNFGDLRLINGNL